MSEVLVAGPELDRQIAERVMNLTFREAPRAFGHPWPKENDWVTMCDNGLEVCHRSDGRTICKLWSPSTSIADAWEVVNRLPYAFWIRQEDKRASTCEEYAGLWTAFLGYVGAALHVHAMATTAPLAICLAALKACESYKAADSNLPSTGQPSSQPEKETE